MDNHLKILLNTSIFSGLPKDQLDKIGSIAVDRRFLKGGHIFSEGDDGNGFFIVTSGLVKIYKLSSEGKEHILHVFGPGEPFGEVAVFTGQPFPANAEAIQESHLLFFPKSDFVRLISENPSLSLNMLAVLSVRLRQFAVKIENLSLKEVPGRLAAYLLYLVDEQGAGEVVHLIISKGQLASLLGTIPETLSRVFAKMADQHLINVKGRNITILNREELEFLAEHGKDVG